MADHRATLTAFALSLPGTREDFPWNERVVKVRDKVFAFLGARDASDEPRMSVKLDESHGHALLDPGRAAVRLRARQGRLGDGADRRRPARDAA